MKTPAVKWKCRDYLVSEDRQPVGRFARWVRRLFEWMGGL